MKRDILYEKALLVYGEEKQKLMLVEEMSELSIEILKSIRNGEIIPKRLIDEIADVEIMLEQIKQLYSLGDSVIARKKFKKKRLAFRLRPPMNVKEVIDKVQRRFPKSVIGDAIALIIHQGDLEEYFCDCGNTNGAVIPEHDTVLNYYIVHDYYDDDSGKVALVITV